MPRMSEKMRHEMSLFINRHGKIEYNRQCVSCVHGCKQSHKAELLACPKFHRNERLMPRKKY